MAGGQAIFEWYCMHLHVKRKKLLILTVFTWFLMLDKIQDGGQDGDHVWWRHRRPAAPPPIKYTSSCREDQRLSTKCEIVSKYCDISKTKGFHPPPSCTTVGLWLCVYVRGLKQTESLKAYLQSSPELCVLFFSFFSRMVLLHLNTREKEYCRISFYRHHYQYDKPQSLQRPTLCPLLLWYSSNLFSLMTLGMNPFF